MTYQLQSLTPPQIARLDEVPIARQEQIIAQTGEPLRLVSSYYLVKNASADFTQPHETARKLDAAMHELLAQKGFWDGTMQIVKPEAAAQEMPAVQVLSPEKPAVKSAAPKLGKVSKIEKTKPFSV
ncbi:MAG: hypothetical protein KDD14_23445, partial [Saprospiraceae bacterium]|nr:hypothetical protein [Saprospiraceae bacterium]